MVHNLNYSTKIKLPNKGKIANTIDVEHNFINLAFNSCLMPNHVSVSYRALPLELPVQQVTLHHPKICNTSLPPLARLPSLCMSDTDWVASVFVIADPDEKLLCHPIDQVALHYADRLVTKLEECLEECVIDQYRGSWGRVHWCINWSRKNLTPTDTYITVLRHTSFDLSYNTNMLLLHSPTTSLLSLIWRRRWIAVTCIIMETKNTGLEGQYIWTKICTNIQETRRNSSRNRERIVIQDALPSSQ